MEPIIEKEKKEEQQYKIRTDINQFLRDGDMINALYDHTLQLLYVQYENESDVDFNAEILNIFNSAYRVCWMAIEKHLAYSEIRQNLKGKRSYPYRLNAYASGVAWSILNVCANIYDYDSKLLDGLRKNINPYEIFCSFQEFVRLQDSPTYKICFCNPVVLQSQENCKEIFDCVSDTPEEKANDLDCLISEIKDKYNLLKTHNEFLQEKLCEQEIRHQKNMETMNTTIVRIKAEMALLQKELRAYRTHVEVKEVVKHVFVEKDNPLEMILNWNTLGDYALSLGKVYDIQVIFNMLNRISTRNRYFDESLTQTLDKIEAYLLELQKHPHGIINNFNEGSSYNDIHDNPESKIDING